MTPVPDPPRAFKFHIGVSFAGKPEHFHGQLTDEQKKLTFPGDSPIGIWKEHALKRKKSVRSVSTGDDFYFVQEVRFVTFDTFLLFILNFFFCPITDEECIGGYEPGSRAVLSR